MDYEWVEKLLVPALVVIITVIARSLEQRDDVPPYLAADDLPTETLQLLEAIGISRDLLTKISCQGLVIMLASQLQTKEEDDD